MKVYIAMIEYPYEGSVIISVHADKAGAENALSEAKKKDESRGYNEFTVEEYEVVE